MTGKRVGDKKETVDAINLGFKSLPTQFLVKILKGRFKKWLEKPLEEVIHNIQLWVGSQWD